MVPFKGKQEFADFKTVNGKTIKLVLKRKERVIQIKIINAAYPSVYKRCVVLLIAVTLNMLALIFHIGNIKIITAIFVATLLELYRISVIIKEEDLIVAKGLGFQITTEYVLGLKTVFIPWEQVQNIFINEVIYRQKVIFVLSLLIKDTEAKEKLVPLFFGSLPRLVCLQLIYRNLKASRI